LIVLVSGLLSELHLTPNLDMLWSLTNWIKITKVY
jgi:hypothetical protein